MLFPFDVGGEKKKKKEKQLESGHSTRILLNLSFKNAD